MKKLKFIFKSLGKKNMYLNRLLVKKEMKLLAGKISSNTKSRHQGHIPQ